ncbi:MAG: hypothetical protein GY757_18795 [bacterium]|nr:hypothetical protein [bacterium]
MKVYLWIKHKTYPGGDEGIQQGDVAYVYPIVADQGKLTHRCYFPIVADLKIPCDKNFTVSNGKAQWKCSGCKWNDPELCDVRKYTQGVWDAGDVFNAPKLIKKRMHKVDLDKVLSVQQKEVILKADKTESEKTQTIDYAVANEKTTTDIEVKK